MHDDEIMNFTKNIAARQQRNGCGTHQIKLAAFTIAENHGPFGDRNPIEIAHGEPPFDLHSAGDTVGGSQFAAGSLLLRVGFECQYSAMKIPQRHPNRVIAAAGADVEKRVVVVREKLLNRGVEFLLVGSEALRWPGVVRAALAHDRHVTHSRERPAEHRARSTKAGALGQLTKVILALVTLRSALLGDLKAPSNFGQIGIDAQGSLERPGGCRAIAKAPLDCPDFQPDVRALRGALSHLLQPVHRFIRKTQLHQSRRDPQEISASLTLIGVLHLADTLGRFGK